MPLYKPVPEDLFPDKQNPLSAGAPGFYEREELFTTVQNLLRAGASVSLVGERKAGKTSFLNYLLAHLPADEFIAVFVDTQKVLPQKDKVFLGRLVKGAAKAIEKAVGLAKSLKIDTPTIEPDEKVYDVFEDDLERLRAKLPLSITSKRKSLTNKRLNI